MTNIELLDNIKDVIDKLTDYVTEQDMDLEEIEEGGYIDALALGINDYLDELRMNDFFGTEGECDPRGDFRDSDEWTVWNIQPNKEEED